jgi:hypothetical protein
VRKRRSRLAALALVALTSGIVAPALATAPVDQYGLFDAQDSVIHDTFTKLRWERRVSSMRVSNAGAITYCSSLALDNGGWRVPTVKELLTIVDEELHPVLESGLVVQKAIDVNAFPATPSETFRAADLFCVDFSSGNARSCNAGDGLRVRCVK